MKLEIISKSNYRKYTYKYMVASDYNPSVCEAGTDCHECEIPKYYIKYFNIFYPIKRLTLLPEAVHCQIKYRVSGVGYLPLSCPLVSFWRHPNQYRVFPWLLVAH